MRRRRTVGIALALLAIGAIGAGAASAATKVLSLYYLETGKHLAVGESLETPRTPIDYKFGKYACEKGVIGVKDELTVSSNAQKTDELALDSNRGGPCNDMPKRAELLFGNRGLLPWTLGLGANGKATLTGDIVIEIGVETFGAKYHCTFEGTKLSGHVTLSGAAAVTLAGKLAHEAGAMTPCNTSLDITSWEFTLVGGEGPVADLVE